MNNYAHPEVLVETDWVKANLGEPGIKLVEIDVDTKAYDAGHNPGAVGFNWRNGPAEQSNHVAVESTALAGDRGSQRAPHEVAVQGRLVTS